MLSTRFAEVPLYNTIPAIHISTVNEVCRVLSLSSCPSFGDVKRQWLSTFGTTNCSTPLHILFSQILATSTHIYCRHRYSLCSEPPTTRTFFLCTHSHIYLLCSQLTLSLSSSFNYSINMPPTATMYGHSPHSSSGLAGSSEGTPDTRFTAFSPEDARPVKTASLTITPLTTTQADPFVTSSAKVKAEQKLSATASDFKPFAQNVSNVQTFDFASSATAALPGMVQNLKNLIGQMPGYGSQTSVAPPVPVKAAPQGTTNQVGAFSTDTSVTRLLQVKTIYKSDVSLPQIVVNSLEASLQSLMHIISANMSSRTSRRMVGSSVLAVNE